MAVTAPGFAIRVQPGQLRFSAAHFITYGGSCENLHGHNFHVRIDASGDNTEDELVVDFVLMTRLTAEVCEQLHDKVLLPATSKEVDIEQRDGLVHVRSYDKCFTLPLENCCLLPLSNTTAEMLAWYIGERLLESLEARQAADHLALLEVAVEEADRQWGICRREIRHEA